MTSLDIFLDSHKLIIISTEEVMFLPPFVHMFVLLSDSVGYKISQTNYGQISTKVYGKKDHDPTKILLATWSPFYATHA